MGYLRLCTLVGIDCSYPKSHYTSFLDLWFKSYGVFKISASIRAGSQPLSMQQILPKTAQNCQNLPKDKTLKFHQKSRFYFFSKIKISMYRECTRACFHCLDFQSKNFHMLFLLSKNGLCMWISAYPLMEIDDFLKVLHLVWAWDFVDMYLTHLEIRI
jgi:hypothetical protein